MSKRLIALLVGVMALAALVAGCGGSDDSGDATVTLTKAEFIKQGDAICKEGEEQSEAEAEEFADENGFDLEKASDEQLEEAISAVLVPTLSRQAEEIKQLGAPEGDEERVEDIVVALEDGTAKIEDDPGLAIEGKPLKRASELAEDYGFEVCGEE